MDQALQRIQKGKSSSTISEVRKGDKKAKLKLPVVLFSGEFTTREDDSLFEHSGFIVLDFDHIDVSASKATLSTDDYVYACWVSPSGEGLKALVKITNPERHRDHFRALTSYFSKNYGLEVDSSGINESRACFESYDEDIIIKDNYKKFGAFASEKSEIQTAKNSDSDHTDYMKLNLAARMIRKSDDGGKHSTLLKAATMCGGYIAVGRMEEEEVIRVLHREIMKHDIDSESDAIATIRRGIENGKTMPIREIINDEKQIQREMKLNDGDMSFISSDDSDFKWINDFANGDIKVGLDTGDQEFDKYFRYKKEFLVINGHSNVGKTTVALYMMVNSSIRHGWKWVVYSSENKTASVKMKLMEFAVDRKAGDMNYNQRKKAYDWVNNHFTIINNDQLYSYLDIILFLEKIVRSQDVDGVFIDPYNSLRISLSGNSGINSHEYHYEAASEFLTFSTTHDVAVWLNMHAVTEAQRRKGDDGLPVAPFAEDTEGGGKFVNRADGFVTIHRKVQSSDPNIRSLSEWHVRKVRETETGGEPTPFDEPVKLIMNTSRTGFKIWSTRKPLFKPVDIQEDSGSYLKFSSNSGFLEE